MDFHIPPDTQLNDVSTVLPLSGEINWGIAKFAVERLREVTTGNRLIVGVVDTGIDSAHPDISANFLAAKSFISGQTFHDGNGHGMHCSGTVASTDPRIGMGPGLRIVHGKGLSNAGSGGGSGIAAAIRWCVEQGAKIVSMSLGSSSEDPIITDAMREVSALGVWVVCAAGNSGGNTPDVDWPGRSPLCISVAALNADLTPASFSSGGAKIDTSFAGVNIWSLRPGGGYAQMSGTSMATPGVAGVLGLYRAGLEMRGKRVPRIEELRETLFSRSADTHTPGDDRRTGPGWISPLLLALNLNTDPPTVGE